MDFKEKQYILDRICFGKYTTWITIPETDLVYEVEFSDPPRSVLNPIEHKVDRRMARRQLPTLEECQERAINEGIWTIEFQKELDEEEGKLKTYQKRLQKFKNDTRYRIVLEEAISIATKKITELKAKKMHYAADSFEYQRQGAIQGEVIRSIVLSIEPELKKKTQGFWDLLTENYYFKEYPSHGQFREIARTEPWRTYWNSSCKSGGDLGFSITNPTELQYNLLYWTRIYDYVFEHPEKPAPDVIESDDALDRWIEDQSKESNKAAGKKGSGRPDADEYTFTPSDSKNAKDIWSKNTSTDRFNIRKREKIIQEKGQVREIDMPDTQQRLRMELVQRGKHN